MEQYTHAFAIFFFHIISGFLVEGKLNMSTNDISCVSFRFKPKKRTLFVLKLKKHTMLFCFSVNKYCHSSVNLTLKTLRGVAGCIVIQLLVSNVPFLAFYSFFCSTFQPQSVKWKNSKTKTVIALLSVLICISLSFTMNIMRLTDI